MCRSVGQKAVSSEGRFQVYLSFVHDALEVGGEGVTLAGKDMETKSNERQGGKRRKNI